MDVPMIYDFWSYLTTFPNAGPILVWCYIVAAAITLIHHFIDNVKNIVMSIHHTTPERDACEFNEWLEEDDADLDAAFNEWLKEGADVPPPLPTKEPTDQQETEKNYDHIPVMIYAVCVSVPPVTAVIAAILDHLLGFRDISESGLEHLMCSYVSLLCF
jgi:hypothetical protein